MTRANAYVAVVATATLVAAAAADYKEFTLSFAAGDYATGEVVGDDEVTYNVIEYKDAPMFGAPGDPSIPIVAYDVIIPYGSTDVSITYTDATYYTTEDLDYDLLPIQEPEKTVAYEDEECMECWSTDWEWTGPIGDGYTSSSYPAEPIVEKSKGIWRGHFATQCELALVNYNGQGDAAENLASINLRVNYTPPDPAPEAERWEWEHIYNKWSDFLKTVVVNPDDVYSYREPVNFVDVIGYEEYEENGEIVKIAYNQESSHFTSYVPIDDDASWPEDDSYPYPYIIITNDKAYYHNNQTGVDIDLTDKLGPNSPFRKWKRQKGIPTIVKTVDAIKGKYTQEGDEYWDWQVAVREYLKQALEDHGPEYVILIGDVARFDDEPGGYKKYWGKWGVIPMRVLVTSNTWEEPNHNAKVPSRADVIPSDLYYTDLNIDGDWNKNGNSYFGEMGPFPEGDQIDAIKPEIACGWVPVDTKAELENWYNKLIKYEKDPNLDLIGGRTYLSRALHILTDEGLSPGCEELKLFTEGYIPASFFKKEMYEEGGHGAMWPRYPEPYDINDAINEGYGLIEIDTHANPLMHYVITRKVNRGNIMIWPSEPDLVHGNVHNTIFAPSVWDLNTDRYGIIYSEGCDPNAFPYGFSVSERYILDPDGGGVAYLGNTRAGWWGRSARLRNKFYDILMRKTPAWEDDCEFLGPAETWSRALDFGARKDYHITYTHMLTGDPETNVWTDDPREFSMTVQTYEEPGGSGLWRVRVTVKDKVTGEGKKLAFVCLDGGNDNYLINITNNDGRVDFRVAAGTSGKITATKHNWVPKQADFSTGS